MEELQTDTLSDYSKKQNKDFDANKEDNVCAANLLNGCEEIDDPLDLMDHCDNESIGSNSNSDVWRGSDSEDDAENKETCRDNIVTNKEIVEPEEQDGENNVKASIPPEEEQTKCTDEAPDGTSPTLETEAESLISENHELVESEEPDKSIDTTSMINDKDSEEEKRDSLCEPILVSDKEQQIKPSEETLEKESLNENAVTKGDEEKTARTVNLQEEAATAVDTEQGTAPVVEVAEESPTVNNEEQPDSIADHENEDPLGDDNIIRTENKQPNRHNNDQEGDECPMDYDAEDDDDFDPSLLCPEVSMAVDDNPVVTTNGGMPDEGTDSSMAMEPLFSTFVDEVTGAEISFNLSVEEQELRRRLYGPTNPVQLTRIHCTACNVHLGSALEGQNNRYVHPLLKVMICKNCYHFYTSGDFDKDEDGSELYCRWCGQGGQVLCCSKCEFVFCKRCIRTNFGRKKMFEIRDSDAWDCFRCNQSQIITQRIACYEFFEYVRREMQRAATLNSSEIWSKDYSRCCGAKKRAVENGEEVKKPKKKKLQDPDYNPLKDKIEASNVTPELASPHAQLANKGIQVPKPIQIVPKFSKSKDNDIEFVRQIPPPHVTIGPSPRPAYRTILPNNVKTAMQPSTFVRISAQPAPPPMIPVINPASRILGSALQGRNMTPSTMMKHEWFEKTVRAAARVNSHLSYTLTQLNKAQSQAASVEELAVVHNKLQEILSSSINSLIQIRKNLRTEFIAGIKTVRLPSKKPETFNNDDDVIFVSAPTTMPMPSTSQPVKNPLVVIDHSKTPVNTSKKEVSTEQPKGYLKVKSVMELQNVPSECITIPDDTPSPPKDVIQPVQVFCNGTIEKVIEVPKATDPLALTPPPLLQEETPKSKQSNETEPRGKDTRTRRSKNFVFKVTEKPTNDMKKMMSVTVNLPKVDLEELQKKIAEKE